MKRLLLPLLVAIALPTAVNSEVFNRFPYSKKDVNKFCSEFGLGEWMDQKAKECRDKLKIIDNQVLLGFHSTCNSAANVAIYDDCLKKLMRKELDEKNKNNIANQKEYDLNDNFYKFNPILNEASKLRVTYKGKVYVSSRLCPSEEQMRWRKVGFLNRKLEELGCMSDKEHEAYWREYKMKKETRPIMIQNTNVKTNVETNTIIQFE